MVHETQQSAPVLIGNSGDGGPNDGTGSSGGWVEVAVAVEGSSSAARRQGCAHSGAWNTVRTANPPFDCYKTYTNNATNDVSTPRGLRRSSSSVFADSPPTDSPFSSVCITLFSLLWYITRKNDCNRFYMTCDIE